MTLLLRAMVPPDQLVVIHAPLGRVEWPGTVEHIQDTIGDLPLVMAPVASGKSLLDRIRERGMFPGPGFRWCTSDFKRGPIERELRRYLKANPRFGGRIVNCLGERADESPDRAKKPDWHLNTRNSKAGRQWYDWLPIHQWTEAAVFGFIADHGQVPHWAYAAGMSRLSCSFCIYGSRRDLRTASKLRPELYREYCDLEVEINHTLSPSQIPLAMICEGGEPTHEQLSLHDWK